MTKTIKNTIIVLTSVFIGILAINFVIQKVTSHKIEKEYIKIEEHKEDIKKYKTTIVALKNNMIYSDSVIAIFKAKNDLLISKMNTLEQYKTTKKNGTITKINVINDMSVTELDRFFTERLNSIP
jgi:uncharacterized protein YccT (UPF0319 family)